MLSVTEQDADKHVEKERSNGWSLQQGVGRSSRQGIKTIHRQYEIVIEVGVVKSEDMKPKTVKPGIRMQWVDRGVDTKQDSMGVDFKWNSEEAD